MEESEFSIDLRRVKDYRTFLADLDKEFKSVVLLYREFKLLEDMALTALKVSPKLHDFISKQQSAVYEKLQMEAKYLANNIERGRVCFVKNGDLNL